MFYSARIAISLLVSSLLFLSVGALADWKLDHQVGFSKFSKRTELNVHNRYAGKARQIPVGFLSLQNSVLEDYTDFNSSRNAFDPGGFNRFSVALPAAVGGDAIALDALGDYMYFQIKDSSTGKHSLQRCTLVGCSLLKADAADPRAVQMGLPSHTLNPQGIIFTWYQNLATSPRTNQLSFFDSANAEHKVLQGDGYVTAVSRPLNPAMGVNGIASYNGKPVLAQLRNNHAQWWTIAAPSSVELVPVAIDGHDHPRVILLENNDAYDGGIFSCDIDWSVNADNELRCVGGLVDMGIQAEFNLGWYLDNEGFLYANKVVQGAGATQSTGALINTNLQQQVLFRDIGAGAGYTNRSSYFYTTIYGDIVFRADNHLGSTFFMLEADKNGDRLGDAWTDVYPTTLNRPAADEDSDGLSNWEEYQFGSNPLKADSDGDQLMDKDERAYNGNPNRRDTDYDNVYDNIEVANGTSLINKDSDGDGYSDYVDDFPLDPTQYEDYTSDTDSDGIPDYIEDRTQGLDSRIADSQKDLDADGLTCLQEYKLGTNLVEADSDDDGLPDGYEVVNQFKPLDPQDGKFGIDNDQDGWSNILEYRAGTSPTNIQEFPHKAVFSWKQSIISDKMKRKPHLRVNAVASGSDGTIYIATSTNVYAIEPNGYERWTANVLSSPLVHLTVGLTGELYVSDANSLTTLDNTGSIISVESGRWYVSTGDNGSLYMVVNSDYMANAIIKLDAAGKELWREPIGSTESGAIVGFNQVYIHQSNTLKAYSKQGELLWTYDGVSRALALDNYDGSIITIYDHKLKRISADGKLLTSRPISVHYSNFSGILLIDKKRNVYSVSENYQYAFNSNFESMWNTKYQTSLSSVGIGGLGHLYLMSGGKLYAVDSNGEQMWMLDDIYAGYSSIVFTSNNTLQIGISSYQIPAIEYDNSYWGQLGRDSAHTNSVCSVSDFDCDGLPDEYENQHGYTIGINDGALDRDDDGLTNYREFVLNSDPDFEDTDGDQIPDGYEVDHGLNLLAADAVEDLDGDGFDNITEYNSGTDLADSAATPQQTDGQLRWNADYHLQGMTADSKGTLYGYADQRVYALDYRGELKWSIPAGILIQPLALFSESRLLLVDNAGIHFIDILTGESTLEIAGSFTGVAKTQGGFVALGYSFVMAYDLLGNVLWSSGIRYQGKHLAINGNGVIYIGGDTHYLSAYSPAGSLLWELNLGSSVISPFAINSLGDLVFSAGSALYSVNENSELVRLPVGGSNYILPLAPVLDIHDAVYVVRNGNTLVKYNAAGEWERSYNLPGTPGQYILDSNGSVIVPFADEVRVYSASGKVNVFTFRESRYTNTPLEVLAMNNRLIASLGNDSITGTGRRISNIYYQNSENPIGWSGVGGGMHHVNSVCGQIDADCDGFSDAYELSIGLDPDLKDIHWDKDHDGISNIRELQLGLNLLSADTDGDGLDDHYELINGLNSLVNDALADADQDGYSNLAEYQAGSDIYDASSTALLENGVKQWEKENTALNFILGPDQIAYVIQNDSLVAYDIKGIELWRSAHPVNKAMLEMMMPDAASLAVRSKYELVVYDTSSGNVRWHVTNPYQYRAMSASGNGDLYLSSDSGIQRYDLSGQLLALLNIEFFHSFVIAADGTLYDYSGSKLKAYDNLGNRIWVKEFTSTIYGIVLDLYGNLLVKDDRVLYQIDSAGQEVWSIQLGNSATLQTAPMVVSLDGTTYIYDSGYTLVAVDSHGNHLWSSYIGKPITGGLLLDQSGDLYFLSGNSLVKVNKQGENSTIALTLSYTPGRVVLTEGQFYVMGGQKLSKLYSESEGLAYGWTTDRGGNHRGNNPCAIPDNDCDGLPDAYETDVGLNPQLRDTLKDADSDGLLNLTELVLGSNMFSTDTDADGMPDGYEVAVGLNPLLNDAYEDADSDGYTNLEEYQAQADPKSVMSK